MAFLITLLVLLAAGPVMGIGALVASSVVGGLILASPVGCMVGSMAHGRIDILFPLSAAFGCAYGLLVGAVAVGVRRVWVRWHSAGEHRDQPA